MVKSDHYDKEHTERWDLNKGGEGVRDGRFIEKISHTLGCHHGSC